MTADEATAKRSRARQRSIYCSAADRVSPSRSSVIPLPMIPVFIG